MATFRNKFQGFRPGGLSQTLILSDVAYSISPVPFIWNWSELQIRRTGFPIANREEQMKNLEKGKSQLLETVLKHAGA